VQYQRQHPPVRHGPATAVPTYPAAAISPPVARGRLRVSGVRSSPHRAPAAVRMPRQERAAPDAPRTGHHTSRWSPRR
jgi:hypothetical protein